MVTIKELNSKYRKEDSNWDFNLFPNWLVKKGIPNTLDKQIVSNTLSQVLIKYTLDTLPASHHEFDRQVLSLAIENMSDITENINLMLEDKIASLVNSHVKSLNIVSPWKNISKAKKLWLIIRGKDEL